MLLASPQLLSIPVERRNTQSQLWQEWVSLVDVKKTDWMESVRLVFDYFCERTPRSFVESREASIVWNYKYARFARQPQPSS